MAAVMAGLPLRRAKAINDDRLDPRHGRRDRTSIPDRLRAFDAKAWRIKAVPKRLRKLSMGFGLEQMLTAAGRGCGEVGRRIECIAPAEIS